MPGAGVYIQSLTVDRSINSGHQFKTLADLGAILLFPSKLHISRDLRIHNKTESKIKDNNC